MRLDAEAVAAATGWSVRAFPRLPSTNDEAARLRDAGAPPRTAVVAEAQSAGRGRGGRAFASPPGGLYVSLLVAADAGDVPGPLTAALSLAAAEAVEEASGVLVGIKWPNDLWIGGRKVAGLLLEAAGPDRPVVAGLGVNVREVPEDLPPSVRAATTCLDAESGAPVAIDRLLAGLLVRVDARLADLGRPGTRRSLSEGWRERLLLRGERVTYAHAGRARRGTLLDASLEEGLLLEDDEEGRVRRRPEHVQDLRPE